MYSVETCVIITITIIQQTSANAVVYWFYCFPSCSKNKNVTTDAGPTLCQDRAIGAAGGSVSPANMRHWAIVWSMLVQRLRRWTNIEPTMAQCLNEFSGSGWLRWQNIGPLLRASQGRLITCRWTCRCRLKTRAEGGGEVKCHRLRDTCH